MSFYRSIAAYYDFIFPPSVKQRAFIERELGGINGKIILEAGCGTGNLSFLLSEQGAEVTGIDLDEEMISKAKAKIGEPSRVVFENLDILEINQRWTSQIFDGVVSFGNTLVHLGNACEVKQFFQDAFEVLKPGGKLLVQIINYDRVLDNNVDHLPLIENDKIVFERYYEPEGSGILFRTILMDRETGYVIKNEVKLFPIRKKQIETMIREVGFRDVSFFGGFEDNSLESHSVPLVFSGEKPAF